MEDSMEFIHEFESFNSAVIALEVMEAIKAVAAKYGLQVKLARNVDYSPQIMTLAYNLLATDTSGKVGKQAEFDKLCYMVGLKPEHYGKMINLQGKLYRISGVRPHAHKNSVCIESSRGKEYVCSPRTVLTNLVA